MFSKSPTACQSKHAWSMATVLARLRGVLAVLNAEKGFKTGFLSRFSASKVPAAQWIYARAAPEVIAITASQPKATA
jgi:hypothetical protein